MKTGQRHVRSGYILAAVMIGLTVVGCALPLLVRSTGRAVFTVCVVVGVAVLAKPLAKVFGPIIKALW